jgi:hypothetical protein
MESRIEVRVTPCLVPVARKLRLVFFGSIIRLMIFVLEASETALRSSQQLDCPRVEKRTVKHSIQ